MNQQLGVPLVLPEGVYAFLREQVAATALEVLGSSHGLQVIDAAEAFSAGALKIVSATHFAGPKLQGTLSFAVASAQAGALLPEDWECEVTLEACCGAVSETSNLLLGCFKRRLLGQDVRISLETPATSCGHTSELSPAPGSISIAHVFRSSLGRVSVSLNAIVDPSLQLGAVVESSLESDEFLIF